jgi:AraC family transcriptional regulator of arabinose operon
MDRRIQVVISRIESDPGSCEFSELAALVHLSNSRLRHLFKQETGTTLAQHLRTARLRKAEVLLRTTFLTVKEIVSQLGLTSSSHFVREFRKLHGMSPTAYRRMNGVRSNRERKKTSQPL